VDASDFHLDAGRLCVMLSRNRVACFIVMRARIAGCSSNMPLSAIGRSTSMKTRSSMWRAHRTLIRQLRSMGRIVSLTPTA
jgi:hypothetical protein